MSKKSLISVRKLTIIGILGGISAILGMTPIGLIPVGPTNATIMHIPVIIGAIIEGPFVGAMVGLIFGIFSIIRAITAPTVISPVLYNPIVSVLPRVLIGITSYYTYILIKKVGKKPSIILLSIVWISSIIYLINSLVTQIGQYSLGNTSIWSIILSAILVICTVIIGAYSFKKAKEQSLEIIISAMVGTLTNTIGVLGSIYLLYGKWYVEKLGKDTEAVGKVILGIGLANGIPEMIIAILIVTSVVVGIRKRF
ncbi:putative membrane protein [Gottschalkia acidurici 9a]|uniref:Membrane protein n=1 Tax=Gottschalkia acidurici (strain ATCC 7906 / DSM 604 / BCRC 14475 / CIP 104303 / KCTC 5404 / NCIMB 10678 / 9a) TaxID=1128398 RepID=K0B3B5_GOTA9|nr:ECF transporter S component [Gottschalkia acidurici]AFS79360.1 putative membrane protein [Gottschalkia acidurici 9a]